LGVAFFPDFLYASSNPAHGEWTALCDSSSVICSRFSPGTPDSSTNKTDRLDIAEILLKVALSSINYQNSRVRFLILTVTSNNCSTIFLAKIVTSSKLFSYFRKGRHLQ
jgi:hypothetical protein